MNRGWDSAGPPVAVDLVFSISASATKLVVFVHDLSPNVQVTPPRTWPQSGAPLGRGVSCTAPGPVVHRLRR